jgi:eukaryotic-like serine/threonine-protein kinase
MTPERMEQIGEILEKALALETDKRREYLDEACEGDSELRREVESLLASHECAGTGFLNTPAAVLRDNHGRPSIRSGQRIGAYNILEQIGHGGMGEVFSAVRADGQYEKKVAIKLVRSGYDTESILERFRDERQILASLDHPNVARLLDGGTTEEGIPYLVMELVEGAPIDDYCDDRKLDVSSRLQLFRQVCGAVQHAHQHLVIHRDLKPSNILVTPEGSPKLLDFGIAKLLDASGGIKATVLRPMTPEYASPEQIRGEPITTATDVYSLGVVLYQLLTGHSPYRLDIRRLANLAEAITHDEPERPSISVQRTENLSYAGTSHDLSPENVSSTREASPFRLQQRLQGDLDFILLKALRKEPDKRYSSVEQFNEDIRRHLEGLPITARKGTWNYRAGKFIRRHRISVAATALLLATLLTGVILVVREARIAEANRRRAEARFNDVRKLANSFMFEFHDAIQDLPGSTPARELVIKRALEYIDGLAQDSSGDPSLQRELAVAYEKLGDVQGNPNYANLGDTSGAFASYSKALAIRVALLAGERDERNAKLGVFTLHNKIGRCQEATGEFAGAMANFQTALQIAENYATRTSAAEDRDWHAGSYFTIAGLLRSKGDLESALQNYRKAMSIREAGVAAYPADLKLRTHLAGDYSYTAHVLMLHGDLHQAIEMNRKALEILMQMTAADPGNATLKEFLSQDYFHQGTFLERKKELTEALKNYRQAESILLDSSRRDPRNALTRNYLGFTDVHIGAILIERGDTSGGMAKLQKALAIFQSLQADPRNRYVLSGLADSYEGLGRANAALARNQKDSPPEQIRHWREARRFYQDSQSIWLKMRAQGALAREDAQKLGPISAQITQCNAALAQLPH